MIKAVNEAKEKSAICNEILRALPDWFGIEESIKEYVHDVKDMIFYAAYESNKPVGFTAIKRHNEYTSEVYVMGILKEYHRQGIGRELIKVAEAYCIEQGMKLLSVKTLADTVENIAYANTRKFYARQGFIPLEVFPDLWDMANPCIMLIKILDR